MMALATKVLTDYGKVLAQVQPGLHGLPQSLLPHSKQQIRGAILMLLENLDPEQTAIKESLARGYVYLAQFVPDEDAALINSNGDINSLTSGNESARKLLNRIKVDMERALEELQSLGVGFNETKSA
jgi:hypothetical protein